MRYVYALLGLAFIVGCAANPETGQSGLQVAAENIGTSLDSIGKAGLLPYPFSMVAEAFGALALIYAGKKGYDARTAAVRAAPEGKLPGEK